MEVKENDHCLNISFKKPTLRYLDEFVKLTCSAELLAWKLFPNAKEITESLAAYNAYRKNLARAYPPNEAIKCIVVGDGYTPRTGAIFAMRSKFNVVSVDPNLRTQGLHPNIKRLICIKAKAEAVDWNQYISREDRVFVVAVHSHAPINSVIDKIIQIKPMLSLISIPCCMPDNIDRPHIGREYEDWGILSEKRKIIVYNF